MALPTREELVTTATVYRHIHDAIECIPSLRDQVGTLSFDRQRRRDIARGHNNRIGRPNTFEGADLLITTTGLVWTKTEYHCGNEDDYEWELSFDEYPLDPAAYERRTQELEAEAAALRAADVAASNAKRIEREAARKATEEMKERAELARLLAKYGNPAGGYGA